MSRKPLKSMKLKATTLLAIQNKKITNSPKKLKKRIYARMENLFLPKCSKRIHSNQNAFITELISNKLLPWNAFQTKLWGFIPEKCLIQSTCFSSNIGCALKVQSDCLSDFCISTFHNKQDK